MFLTKYGTTFTLPFLSMHLCTAFTDSLCHNNECVVYDLYLRHAHVVIIFSVKSLCEGETDRQTNRQARHVMWPIRSKQTAHADWSYLPSLSD